MELTITEAAAQTGLSPQVLMSAVREGSLRVVIPEGGFAKTARAEGRRKQGRRLPAEIPFELRRDLESVSRRDRGVVIRSARMAGWTLDEIGSVMGISRERVRQIDAAALVDPDELREYPNAPYREGQEPKEPKVKAIETVPDYVIQHLKEMHGLVSQVRGFTPLDDPSRDAIPQFADLILNVMLEFGVSDYALSQALGLSRITLKFWLRRHGYLPNYPSQTEYRHLSILNSDKEES